MSIANIEKILSKSFHAFFGPENDLKHQLKARLHAGKDLVLAPSQNSEVYFQRNQWANPRVLRVNSEAQVNEVLQSFGLKTYLQGHGNLKSDSVPAIEFGIPARPGKWVEWTYLTKEYLLLCETLGSFPLNQISFKENAEAPSRAYLKLWEFFTRIGQVPKKSEVCFDFGSAPGGWTWVLNSLGAKVFSFDRATLSPELMESPNVEHNVCDAFSVSPREGDWFFSDLICYPDKLYEFVQAWKSSGKVKNFVCTLKFKGATDWKAIEKFSKLGGDFMYLSHNKHELTWYFIGN